MLYHNENDSDGIQEVLTALHKYVPHFGDEDERVYSSQGAVADQLSVERGINALFEVANGFTPEERLEGLHLEIADWHAGNKFLQVSIIEMFACIYVVLLGKQGKILSWIDIPDFSMNFKNW